MLKLPSTQPTVIKSTVLKDIQERRQINQASNWLFICSKGSSHPISSIDKSLQQIMKLHAAQLAIPWLNMSSKIWGILEFFILVGGRVGVG